MYDLVIATVGYYSWFNLIQVKLSRRKINQWLYCSWFNPSNVKLEQAKNELQDTITTITESAERKISEKSMDRKDKPMALLQSVQPHPRSN